MRTALALCLFLAAICHAEDKQPTEQKRLESVTWDLNLHKLVWVVQHGNERNGHFVATGSDRYEISPDEATMKFANEERGFTAQEAASLHKLLDTLSLYCVESVIWWDRGEGEKIDSGARSEKEKVQLVPAAPVEEPARLPPVEAILVVQGAR